MTQLTLVPASTALVLIDLQHSTVARELAPHTSQQVLDRCASLSAAVRRSGGMVVFVRVLSNEILRLASDISLSRDPSAAPLTPQDMELVPQAGVQPGDIVITKRQWGAFHATDLDQQLRRRGVRTLILGGIATNFGVESTARAAFDQGYELVFAEDAMSSLRSEMHEFSVSKLFPFMGRVRSTEELVQALTLA